MGEGAGNSGKDANGRNISNIWKSGNVWKSWKSGGEREQREVEYEWPANHEHIPRPFQTPPHTLDISPTNYFWAQSVLGTESPFLGPDVPFLGVGVRFGASGAHIPNPQGADGVLAVGYLDCYRLMNP